MADSNKMQWTVAADPNAAKDGIEQLATMIGLYYHAVLRKTNNQALTEKLTVEYQKTLFDLFQNKTE